MRDLEFWAVQSAPGVGVVRAWGRRGCGAGLGWVAPTDGWIGAHGRVGPG